MNEFLSEKNVIIYYVIPNRNCKKIYSNDFKIIAIPKYLEKVIIFSIENLVNEKLISFLARRLLKKINLRNFDVIIGIDRLGLIIMSAFPIKVKKIFYSFEIMFEDETSHKYKKIEKEAGKTIDLWITQDQVRKNLLLKENQLDKKKSMIIPIGLRSRNHEFINNKCINQNSMEKKTALLIGSVTEWTMGEELIESVLNWPRNWQLIIHARNGILDKKYLQLIDKVNSKNASIVVDNTKITRFNDLRCLMSKAECGLVFYKSTGSKFTGKNIKYIGRSSGKVATFCYFGIPLISNITGIAREDINNHASGIILEDLALLPRTLQKFSKERFIQGAHSQHKDIFNFRNYETNLYGRLFSD